MNYKFDRLDVPALESGSPLNDIRLVFKWDYLDEIKLENFHDAEFADNSYRDYYSMDKYLIINEETKEIEYFRDMENFFVDQEYIVFML